jgi:NAD(P)-dependent dehydrogenase (short-subunit alcohol dehydrogenase family)
MVQSLFGRVTVITGGGSGIGRATAEQLARDGARMIIAGRDRERGEAAVRAARGAGGDACFVRTDVASERSVRAAIDTAVDLFGGIDYLFNCAGCEGPMGPITDLTEDECDQILAVNLKGPMMAAKHAIPHMVARGGGCVVNAASFLGTVPFPVGAAYGASKAGLIHFTRSLAMGYAAQGVRAYAVCPYVTDTPMTDRLTGGHQAMKQRFAGMNPSGRIAQPEDIACVVAELFAGVTDFESGDAVLVDSGAIATRASRPAAVV